MSEDFGPTFITVTDEDGNTTQPSDEENEVAYQLAQEAAETALKRCDEGETDLSAMAD